MPFASLVPCTANSRVGERRAIHAPNCQCTRFGPLLPRAAEPGNAPLSPSRRGRGTRVERRDAFQAFEPPVLLPLSFACQQRRGGRGARFPATLPRHTRRRAPLCYTTRLEANEATTGNLARERLARG